MPAMWWPATVGSTLTLVVATTALVLVLLAIYREDRLSEAPGPLTTAAPVQVSEQDALPLPDQSVPLNMQSPVTGSPLSTPETPGTAAPAVTCTPIPEPTNPCTPQPTNTPTSEPTSPCTPEPATNTPIPEPTGTFTPEPTSTPTPTSSPTPTLIPVPDPRFRADQTTLIAGACTRLRWDVDGVRAVYLDGAGRPGHSVEEVCPEISHTYTLTVVTPDGREAHYPLHIQMIGYRPLILNVLVTYRGCDTREAYRAEISIWAQGGNKQYTYYLSTLDHYIGGPTDKGMVHRVSWRTCGGMPGTLIVRSGDGQEARQPFWVDAPPCCGRF